MNVTHKLTGNMVVYLRWRESSNQQEVPVKLFAVVVVKNDRVRRYLVDSTHHKGIGGAIHVRLLGSSDEVGHCQLMEVHFEKLPRAVQYVMLGVVSSQDSYFSHLSEATLVVVDGRTKRVVYEFSLNRDFAQSGGFLLGYLLPKTDNRWGFLLEAKASPSILSSWKLPDEGTTKFVS